MAQVPTGTLFAIASAIAATKATTVVTNASEAVVTSTAHGYSNSDIVLLTSGWGRLNGRCARIKSVTTDTFVLEGIDTSDTNYYPAGSGIGTVQKVTTFTQISTIMNPNSSGGEARTVEYKFMESDVNYSINDGFSAVTESFEIDADQIGTTAYTALKTLTDAQTETILKKTMRSGSIIYTPGKVTLNENVKFSEGQINRCTVSFNASNRITRYAS